MKKLLSTLFNHERYQAIAFTITIGLTIWLISCDSKVRSITNPAVKVTRAELQNELDYYLSQVNTRIDDLDRQDEVKKALFDASLLMAQGGAINPIAIITTMAAIGGIGATVDNVRKRKRIKTLENSS